MPRVSAFWARMGSVGGWGIVSFEGGATTDGFRSLITFGGVGGFGTGAADTIFTMAFLGFCCLGSEPFTGVTGISSGSS